MSSPAPSQTFNIPAYVLDDLCSRFVINIPEEERNDLVRIFFQIELAHWFYLDFYCEEINELKPCGIKDFSSQIFCHCPFLSGHAGQVDKILEEWKVYKMSVPTYGAIMMDPTLTHVLLVQGFRTKCSWGFPKGKVNENEPPRDCAIREVYEETGYRISENEISETNFLETMRNQLTRLYLIPGIGMDVCFQPQSRNEIKELHSRDQVCMSIYCLRYLRTAIHMTSQELQWFRIDSLPAHSRDQVCMSKLNLRPNCFFMVIPFIKPLRKWIESQKETVKTAKGSKRSERAKSTDRTDKPADNKTKKNKKQRSNSGDARKVEKMRLKFAQANRDQLNIIYGIETETPVVARAYQPGEYPWPNRQAHTQSDGPDVPIAVVHAASPTKSTTTATTSKGQPTSQSKSHQDGSTCQVNQTTPISDTTQNEKGSTKGKANKTRRSLNTQLNQPTDAPITGETPEFSSPAWLNFKFDLGPIMACFP